MLAQIDGALAQLQELAESHGRVSDRTTALYAACENMLHEQTRLVATSDAISSRLAYFDEADRMGARCVHGCRSRSA